LQAAPLGQPDGEHGENCERGRKALRMRKGDLLLAGGEDEMGGLHPFAAILAGDRNRQRARRSRGLQRLRGVVLPAAVADGDDRVAGAQREGVVHQLERLLDQRVHPAAC
jgi:hypothetical protein